MLVLSITLHNYIIKSRYLAFKNLCYIEYGASVIMYVQTGRVFMGHLYHRYHLSQLPAIFFKKKYQQRIYSFLRYLSPALLNTFA